jgi:hypothetical protein
MFRRCYYGRKRSDDNDGDDESIRKYAMRVCTAQVLFWENAVFLALFIALPLIVGSERLLMFLGWSHTEPTSTQLAACGILCVGLLNFFVALDDYLPSSHNPVIYINIIYYFSTTVVFIYTVFDQRHPESMGIMVAFILCALKTLLWLFVGSALSTVTDKEIKACRKHLDSLDA